MKKYRPKERLVSTIEQHAEAIMREFKPHHLAKTLWAYATMARMPGERMMGLLKGRTEVISGEFNTHNVAKTLWAYAVMGRMPRERLNGLLEKQMEAAISREFDTQQISFPGQDVVLRVPHKIPETPGVRNSVFLVKSVKYTAASSGYLIETCLLETCQTRPACASK